jgi:hypothetical protein
MTAYRFALWIALGTSAFAGCRACSSPYDYSSPVSDCVCGTGGCGRAGSNMQGHGGSPEDVVYENEHPIYETEHPQMMPMPAN